MNRRGFLKDSAIGVVGATVGATGGWVLNRELEGGSRPTLSPLGKQYRAKRGPTLFPTDLPSREWAQFRAEGFSQPACGIVYRKRDVVPNGMPLGGVATGCIDLQTDGTLGYCTLFNSGVPTRGPLREGFLGISTGGRSWVLTTKNELPLVGNAEDIAYWGHYPIADMEYEIDAPISVGLRAWTPFIPGDVEASNIPASVFEVHVRNLTKVARKATLGFSFPGPTQAEAQISPTSVREPLHLGAWPISRPIAMGMTVARRTRIRGKRFNGIEVSSEFGAGYALGVIGQESLRFGAPLWIEGYEHGTALQWQNMEKRLPPLSRAEFGSSIAVDLDLKPREHRIIRIVLAWYSPIWKGEGKNYYARMYTRKFKSAAEVAQKVGSRHGQLLRRVLNWQQAVYVAKELPIWLRESLVNILHLMTKTGYWAAAQAPLGDWCKPEDGLFGMNECPRECPQIECIPCSFYGNVPLVYFFPELARSTLRGYKAYQFPNGAPPWIFGGCTGSAIGGYHSTDGADMATPSPGYQCTLNGPCYVDMFDRYWQRTGDDNIVKEFYESLKKAVIYTINLRPGPEGIISVPAHDQNPTRPYERPGRGLDWFEGNGWFGMTPHVGGIHLAMLRMMVRIADHAGDPAFAEQCLSWIKTGESLMESKLWTGRYYLAYFEPETNKKSDLVFAYQLDGQWMTNYHGCPGVFPDENVSKGLETIKNTCIAIDRYGAANFCQPDGKPVGHVGYGTYGYFPPEVFMLAATYIYNGHREIGLRLARLCLEGISVKGGYTWTQPNVVDGRTGKRVYGADYYQNMLLWALPAALSGHDIQQATGTGSLVQRVLDAGQET